MLSVLASGTLACIVVVVGISCLYRRPEVLHGRDYSVAADIYSLGMVLTELDSHAIPFRHMARMSDVALMCAVMNGSVCPTAFTPSCPDWLQHLATLCTSHDPNERPTIYQVQNALQAVRV